MKRFGSNTGRHWRLKLLLIVSPALWANAFPLSIPTRTSCPDSEIDQFGVICSSLPQRSLATLALKSSLRQRKTFVRKVCSSVRQDSPGSALLSELMLCVATIGMHFDWRDKAKNFSSPDGSDSPTVANAWYSSQRNNTGRNSRSGCAAIFGIRCNMARWKSSFNMQPIARAVAVLLAAGMFSASTLPDPISSSNDGSGIPYRPSAFATGSNASRGGQKIRFTCGLSSKSDRNTEIPSTIEDRSFGSIRDQSCVNHRFVASNWPTSSEKFS